MRVFILFFFILTAVQLEAQNVGIGTTQPKASLHIRGLSTIENPDLWLNSSDIFGATRLKISGPGIQGKYWLMQSSLDTDINNPNNYLLFYRVTDSAAGVGIPSLLINKDGYLGIGTFDPTAPLSFPQTLGKKISLFPGGNGDAGFAVFGNELRQYIDDVNGNITFGFDNYTNGFTERMRIQGNGNVGIGTTTPTSSLNVNGQVTIDQKNFGGYGGLYIKGDGPGINYPNIAFGIKNTANNDVVAAMVQGDLVNKTAGNETIDLNFLTSAAGQGGLSSKMLIKGDGMVRIAGQQSAGTGNKSLSIGGFGDIDVDKPGTEGGRFKILENGNVGVGVSNPVYRLDVGGRMRIRSGGDNNTSAGIYFNNNANNLAGFVGMQNDNQIGFWGSGTGWGFAMNTQSGALSVGGNTGNPGQVLMSNGSAGSAVWAPGGNIIKTGSSPGEVGLIELTGNTLFELTGTEYTISLTQSSRIIFFYKIKTFKHCLVGSCFSKWYFETHINGVYNSFHFVDAASYSVAPPADARNAEITLGPDYFDFGPGIYTFRFYGRNIFNEPSVSSFKVMSTIIAQ